MEDNIREEILDLIEEEDVEFIRLQLTDMCGNMKNIAITAGQMEKAFNNHCVIEGASLPGFGGEKTGDLFLAPDLSTFAILPWRPQQGKVARLICDILKADGSALAESPRYILKRTLARAAKKGYTFQVGTELEFFLFHTDDNGLPTTITHEQAGYLDLSPLDLGENARRDMVLTLEDMGIEVESSHHELAPAQHEIDFRYSESLKAADEIMTAKMAMRTIAKRHGLHATFMPKPVMGEEGSGMHMYLSLEKDGRNIFADDSDPLGLSREAYWFMGGIMHHINALMALTNPLVNSYKRLIPDFEAPVWATWSAENGSQLIRIPSIKGARTRLELRWPDPSANPYLVHAACLAAGLWGMEHKIDPPAQAPEKIKRMDEEEIEALGIRRVPQSLPEALLYLEKDELMRDVLGETFLRRYIREKRREWQSYAAEVSEWEIQRYLYRI